MSSKTQKIAELGSGVKNLAIGLGIAAATVGVGYVGWKLWGLAGAIGDFFGDAKDAVGSAIDTIQENAAKSNAALITGTTLSGAAPQINPWGGYSPPPSRAFTIPTAPKPYG